jgi:predicted DNA-binding protein (UPF0251 family)
VTKLDETISPEMIDAGMFFDVDDGSIPEEIAYLDFDFENNEYNFLLQIDMKIKEMCELNQLTIKELEILRMLSDGNSYKEAGKKINIGKNSVRKIFNSTCSKIAFALGGVFTNEGYAEYMKERHNLSDIEVSKMIMLIESNRRL